MGRSVMVPGDARAVAYCTFPFSDDPDVGADDWRDFLNEVRDTATRAWPTMRVADRWAGRESHVVAERPGVASIVVCEYCGLVSISLCAPAAHTMRPVDAQWVRQLVSSFHRRFKAYSRLQSLGHASNGEQFFRERQAV